MAATVIGRNFFQSDHCPPAALHVMFKHLPVHNVARLSSVCKYWNSQIKAPSSQVSTAISRVRRLSVKEVKESHSEAIDLLEVNILLLSRINCVFYCHVLGENGVFVSTTSTLAIDRNEIPPNHSYVGAVGNYFLTSHEFPRRTNPRENYEFCLFHHSTRLVTPVVQPFNERQALLFWRTDTIAYCGKLQLELVPESDEKTEKVEKSRFWTLSKKGLLSHWEIIADKVTLVSETRIGTTGKLHDEYTLDITVVAVHQGGDILYSVIKDEGRKDSYHFGEYRHLSSCRKMEFEMPNPRELTTSTSGFDLASLRRSTSSTELVLESPRMKKRTLFSLKKDQVSPSPDYPSVWRDVGVPHSHEESVLHIEGNDNQMFYYGTMSVTAFSKRVITTGDFAPIVSHDWTIRMSSHEKIDSTFTTFGNKWILLHFASFPSKGSHSDGFRILHATTGVVIRSISFDKNFKAWLLDTPADMIAYQDPNDIFFIMDIHTGITVYRQHIPHTIHSVKYEIDDDKNYVVSIIYSKISMKGRKVTGFLNMKFPAIKA